jgi:hypothetical protein
MISDLEKMIAGLTHDTFVNVCHTVYSCAHGGELRNWVVCVSPRLVVRVFDSGDPKIQAEVLPLISSLSRLSHEVSDEIVSLSSSGWLRFLVCEISDPRAL